jgi:hypothetical protein
MKKLLVLAGGSKRNQVWGESCVQHFNNQFDNVFFIHYDHWATDEKNINFETELEKIKKMLLKMVSAREVSGLFLQNLLVRF